MEERKVKEGVGEMLDGLPSQQTQATQQPQVFSRVSSSARTPGPRADQGMCDCPGAGMTKPLQKDGPLGSNPATVLP